jgi:predicted component of type VI protein secretion system
VERLSGPHAASAVELVERLDAERRGRPFLVLRDDQGTQHLIELPQGVQALSIGRGGECGVALAWDHRVSRVHAELVALGRDWALDDGGLSRNGSYVNGERVQERRRLRDGDTLRFGATAVLFRQPGAASAASMTQTDEVLPLPADLSRAQRAILRELCRPFAGATGRAQPATNRAIAERLFLSLDAVKGHLRILFAKFQLEPLPQNEKRLRLAERAMISGAVTLADLREDAPEPAAQPPRRPDPPA